MSRHDGKIIDLRPLDKAAVTGGALSVMHEVGVPLLLRLAFAVMSAIEIVTDLIDNKHAGEKESP